MRTPLRNLVRVFVCAGTVALIAPSTLAQGALSRELVENANPSDTQINQIEDLARRLCETLRTGDRQDVQRARRDLLRPFTGFQTQSVAFRLSYGRTVVAELGDVVTGDDIHRAVNALTAIGPLGLPESVDVLERAIADERSAVRLAAANALGDAIQTDTRVQILRDPAMRALRLAGEALTDEQDPTVGAALVSAMAVPQANQTMLPEASSLLARTLPEVVRGLPEGFDRLAWGKALARAGATASSGVLNADPANPNDASRIRAASLAMAANLAFVRRVLEEHEDLSRVAGTPLATVLEEIVATAFAQIELGAQRLGVSAPMPDLTSALDRAIENTDPADFDDALDRLRPALERLGLGAEALDPAAP